MKYFLRLMLLVINYIFLLDLSSLCSGFILSVLCSGAGKELSQPCNIMTAGSRSKLRFEPIILSSGVYADYPARHEPRRKYPEHDPPAVLMFEP